jgi:hypothetical protein
MPENSNGTFMGTSLRITNTKTDARPSITKYVHKNVGLSLVSCGSRKIALIMFEFKNKIFYLISVHKYKLFFPFCL